MTTPRTAVLLPWLIALPSLPTLSALPAQQPTDWRMPFRNPAANLVPPKEMFEDLRIMQKIAAKAQLGELSYGEDGIEVCDDPGWLKARERLSRLPQDAGYLSAVIRESGIVADRATAFYGAFYLPNTAVVCQLIEHIPGEPVRSLRQDAFKRAIAFLQVHLPRVNEGDLEAWEKLGVGPGGQKPPRPGDPSYGFDPVPFVALLRIDDHRDHQQALWFLTECMHIRPQLQESYLDLTKDLLPGLLGSEEPAVQKAAERFLQQADPKHRPAPAVDAPDGARTAWLDEVLYEVFPPIRTVSDGLIDLYPSDDRDQIVAVAEKRLADGTLGATADGTLKNGTYYRGFQIAAAPPPLDKLGMKPGFVITHINGVPVATGADILKALRGSIEHKRSFLVEYVDGGAPRAKEFRVQAAQ